MFGKCCKHLDWTSLVNCQFVSAGTTPQLKSGCRNPPNILQKSSLTRLSEQSMNSQSPCQVQIQIDPLLSVDLLRNQNMKLFKHWSKQTGSIQPHRKISIEIIHNQYTRTRSLMTANIRGAWTSQGTFLKARTFWIIDFNSSRFIYS